MGKLAKIPGASLFNHIYKLADCIITRLKGGRKMSKITTSMSMDEIQKILKSGGEITFQKGTYIITKPLILYSNSRINFNGATLRQGANINHVLLTYTDKNTTGYNGEHNIEIYGGKIEGMGKYKTKLNLLTLCHANNIDVHDMEFYDVIEFHDIEINSSRNVIIRNNKFAGFNSSIDTDDFRECIQLDWAVESALVVVPPGSKWFDGTPCRNITIENNTFGKSASRPAPSQCIGNHCQVSGLKHENIHIRGNTFIGGNQTYLNGCCVSLVGMSGVTVENNTCEGYGRFLRIYTLASSYGLSGKTPAPLPDDGVCRNITVRNNRVIAPSSTFKSCGIWSTSKTGRHRNIFIENNRFEQHGVSTWKYAIDIGYADCVNIGQNETGALRINCGSTCTSVNL